MVEQYYFKLLGIANSEVRPYSVEHIKSLQRFRCNNELAACLTAIPTSIEVKAALLALPKTRHLGLMVSLWSSLSFFRIL